MAYDFIYKDRQYIGSTGSYGMGSKNDDLYGAFINNMLYANGVQNWHDTLAYTERQQQGKFVRTDTALYQQYTDKINMAKKLIDASASAIDDIAKQYDGVNLGLGYEIINGSAMVIGGQMVKVGQLIQQKDSNKYGVITKVYQGGCEFLDEGNRTYSNVIGEREIVLRGYREQYGIDDFVLIDDNTPQFLQAVKQLAQIAVNRRADGNYLALASHIPAINAYIADNPDLRYEFKTSYGMNGIDIPLGFLLAGEHFDKMPSEFLAWYKDELAKHEIVFEKQNHQLVYQIPQTYSVKFRGYPEKQALAFIDELCNQNNWAKNDEFLTLMKEK